MTAFGEDLIQTLGEVLPHMKGEGPVVVPASVGRREVRKPAGLTRADRLASWGGVYPGSQMGAGLVRSGPAAMLLCVIAREPKAVKRMLEA